MSDTTTTTAAGAVTVEAWENGMGHHVFLSGRLLAEVFSPPQRRGVLVKTFDAQGEPDLVLDHPFKADPRRAAALCLALGRPAELAAHRSDLAALRRRHGEGAVILLDHDDHVRCLGDDAPLLASLGVPESFCKSQLEEFSLRLIAEGRKVVLCPPETAQQQGEGGGA